SDESATMLAMDADRETGEQRGECSLQGGEITGVHDVGCQFAKQPVQRRKQPISGTLFLVKLDEAHVDALDAAAKNSDIRQRHDDMPIRILRQPIHEVHDAVLESP